VERDIVSNNLNTSNQASVKVSEVEIKANKGNIKRSKRVIETKLLRTMYMKKYEVNGQSKQIENGLER